MNKLSQFIGKDIKADKPDRANTIVWARIHEGLKYGNGHGVSRMRIN